MWCLSGLTRAEQNKMIKQSADLNGMARGSLPDCAARQQPVSAETWMRSLIWSDNRDLCCNSELGYILKATRYTCGLWHSIVQQITKINPSDTPQKLDLATRMKVSPKQFRFRSDRFKVGLYLISSWWKHDQNNTCTCYSVGGVVQSVGWLKN